MQTACKVGGGGAFARMLSTTGLMLRVLSLVTGVVFLCQLNTGANAAENHVALIIGNAHYQNAPELRTPINDVEDIAAGVTALGFDVTLLKDATGDEMRAAIKTFTAAAGKSNLAVMFYAGHSFAFAGENYMVPVDAAITKESLIETQAVPLRFATRTVAKAKVLGLIVFDALRPNSILANIEHDQFKRQADLGTETSDAFPNVISFFAAETGKTAVDIEGRNSPMTKALMKYVNDPNLEINFLFRSVRDEVRKSTQNRQTPFMYGQLGKQRFYLHGAPAQTQAAFVPQRALGRDPNAVLPCDEKAASPDDTERVKLIRGVRIQDIDVREAYSACQDAAKMFPGVSRFPYQLGRIAMARKDYAEAMANYTKAFELGNNLALQALAAMYEEGSGIPKNPERARFYYEFGAAKNHAPSILSLGMQYERGAGVNVDVAKAYTYYKRAADLGNARAIYNVGLFNEKGILIEKNEKLARELYEKSAQMGDDVAMINLARLYVRGIGGPKDPSKAKEWLNSAEQAGNEQAKQILAEMNKKTEPPKKRR
jgi:tetratricopeptide (TPR) repeat protein